MKVVKISFLLPAMALIILIIGCNSQDNASKKFTTEPDIIKADTRPNKELTAKISVSNSFKTITSAEIGTKLSNSKYANQESFDDPEWITSQDSILIIDFEWENLQSIGSISINLGNDFRSQIYPPKQITLKLSRDGSTYKNGSAITRFDQTKMISKTEINFGPNDVKKLRLIIEGYGLIKKGLPGEGKRAQLYLDDVIIN